MARFDEKLMFDYIKRDIGYTLETIKHTELKKACDDLYAVFEALTKAGFNDNQALMMISILLNK